MVGHPLARRGAPTRRWTFDVGPPRRVPPVPGPRSDLPTARNPATKIPPEWAAWRSGRTRRYERIREASSAAGRAGPPCHRSVGKADERRAGNDANSIYWRASTKRERGAVARAALEVSARKRRTGEREGRKLSIYFGFFFFFCSFFFAVCV